MLKQCGEHADVVAVADQWWHNVKAFSISHSDPTMRRLGVGKRIGGDKSGRDLNSDTSGQLT